MKNSIIGILSLCFGLIGFFSAFWYIGIIPCVIAVVLGIIGLMDYLAYKWSSVMGLICAGMGILLFSYTVVKDINAGDLIIACDKGDFVYVSNVDKYNEALGEFAQILSVAEVKAAQKAVRDSDEEQSDTADYTVEYEEEWIRDSSVENTIVVDNTAADHSEAGEKIVEETLGGYVKGTNYGTYWESEWLGMRYDQPSGFTLLSDSQLNDALQVGNNLVDGAFGEGTADIAGQNTVYELMVMSPSGNPNFNLGVEKSEDSVGDYAGRLGLALQAYYGDSLVNQSGFEGTQGIGGLYFEKYSFIVDDGALGMHQTYYITKKEDRMVYIIVTYTENYPEDADAILSGFSEL